MSASPAIDVAALERAVSAEPEDLRLAAQYRQLNIQTHEFDRSIRFLDQLARHPQGPNIFLSLALAYVDKVPTAGEIRRLYLGRDAIGALTKAIERQPSVLAYYARGLINLYYDVFIFKRAPKGVADLEQSRALITAHTPPELVRRVYAALGDGHFRVGETDVARQIWTAGLERFPSDAGLKARLAAPLNQLRGIVSEALDPDRRVDTSLVDLLPTF